MTNRRKQKGAALVSVIVLGVVGMLFLYGIASVITSGVRATSANKWVEGLRNCAEVGMDYAVDRFNTVYPCPLDPISNGSSKTTILPASELIAAQTNGIIPNAGVPNATVTITVTRLNDDSDWSNLKSFSSVYSPQLDPSKSVLGGAAPPESSLKDTGGGYRIIECKATNGLLTRTIRVVLKARFEQRPDDQTPLDDGQPTTTKSYFEQPSFGNTAISVTSLPGAGSPVSITGMGTDPADGGVKSYHVVSGTPDFKTYNLNLASNKSAVVGSNVTLSGNVNVTSSVANASDIALTADGIIEGRVLANGTLDSNVKGFDTYPGSENVQSRADSPTGDYNPTAPRFGDNTISSSIAGSNQYQAAPVVTPSSAQTLADLSTYVSDGTFPINGNGKFQTGSLSTDSIATGKNLTLPSTPVSIFVDQGGNASQAVSIDTSKLTTTSSRASDFQIWYGGNRDVTINMTEKPFTGTIYAPNARVSITGKGNFKGALVGKSVDIRLSPGSTVEIDTDLSKPPSSDGSGIGAPINMTYKYKTGSKTAAIEGWQPITWQEYGAAMP